MEEKKKKVRGQIGAKAIKPTITHKQVSPLSEQGTTSQPKRKLTQKEQDELNEEITDAAKNGKTKYIERLIRLGADVNIRDTKKWTLLMWAAFRGRTDTCKFLIEQGVGVNIQDNDGWTALMRAARWNYTETVKYLLSVGANPLLKDKGEYTAYEWGRNEKVKSIIKMFENLWKKLGKKQTLLLMQNINAAIRDCSPDKMYEIVVNL